MSEPHPLPIEIGCAAAQALLSNSGEDVLLVDCREHDEFGLCSIPGAVLLPMSELRDRIDELAPHQESRIIVHCHHGGRSLRVAAFLRQQGYARAQSLSGGIDEWSQSIDPTIPRY